MTTDAEIIEAARRLVAAELAPPSRIAHGVLLGVASAMTLTILSLLLTEPALPVRTAAALIGLTVIGMAWSGYAFWALARRHVLYGAQRVVAGWIALGAATAFSLGGLAVGIGAGQPAGLVAGVSGVPTVIIAALMLSQARRRVTILADRLDVIRAGAMSERSTKPI